MSPRYFFRPLQSLTPRADSFARREPAQWVVVDTASQGPNGRGETISYHYTAADARAEALRRNRSEGL